MHDRHQPPAADLADALVTAGIAAAVPAATSTMRGALRTVAHLLARHRVERDGRLNITRAIRAALASPVGQIILRKLGGRADV